MSEKTIKIYIAFLFILGIFLSGIYFYLHLVDLLNNEALDIEKKQILISSITLNLSWVFLYIFFILKPKERRYILLLSAFSMLFSHLLYISFVATSFHIANTFTALILSLMFFSGNRLLHHQAFKSSK